jgi:mono/diheme cytochrome c family protein
MRTFITIIAVSISSAIYAQGYDPLGDFVEVKPSIYVDAPSSAPATSPDNPLAEQIEHGRYMAELLGCPVCHTDGALVGEARDSKPLAGSRIGIAYSNPLTHDRPGIVYPGNLTPDVTTGIGAWSENDLAKFIRSGLDPSGRQHLSVMPWLSFARLTDKDTRAIVTYLRSLPPVEFKVPDNVAPGEQAVAPYVHFGVYRSRKGP